MNKDAIVVALREGKMTPDEAIIEAEKPVAKHISEVPLDSLRIDTLDCGFPTLNDLMVFKRGQPELIVFGARPSMGKSAFLLQVASHVAKTHNVLINSLEDSKETIKRRMLAGATGYSLQKIFKGEVPKSKLEYANAELSQLKYFIDDRSGIDIQTLKSSAIQFHRKNPVSLMVVDYLQQIVPNSQGNRNDQVAEISYELKELAKALRCPVLVAAQLNRKCIDRGHMMMVRGKEPDFRPELGDLKESGNIEQDADAVIFLSRHEQISEGFRVGEADVGVAKQRNGPTGWNTFRWLGASTRFLDPRGEI